MLALTLAAGAQAHTLPRDTARHYATIYAKAVVAVEDDDIHDFDLARCWARSAHRVDCAATFFYSDGQFVDGACAVTLTVQYSARMAQRIKVFARDDWECRPEA